MTARPTPWLAAPIVALTGLVAVAALPAPAEKSIFVGAVDEAGRPLKDLKTEEFRLREDGTDREIVAVRPASQPLTIELLADTTSGAEVFLQDIRTSLAAFVRKVQTASPDSPIQLMEFGQAARPIIPFSTSTADVEKGIARLVARPDAKSVLYEAIARSANELAKRPSPRRAVVILNLEPSEEESSEDPRRVLEGLRKAGAQVWAVSLQQGNLKNPQRDLVLNAITKNTGGAREYIVSQSALENVLGRFADVLLSQYEVVYKRPDGRAPVQVQVGVTRQGVRLHASGFAPQ